MIIMPKSCFKIPKKNYCPINNQATFFSLFPINLLIFQNPCKFFQFFLRLPNFLKILKSENKVINFGFVTTIYIADKIFSGDSTNSCTVIALHKRKKN